MTNPIFVLLLSATTLGAVSALYFHLLRQYPKTTKIDDTKIKNLIRDGINSYTKRVISNSLQIIAYVVVVILTLSWVLKSEPGYNQLVAISIGGISLLLATLIQFKSTSKMTHHVLGRSGDYPKEALYAQFLGVHWLGTVYMAIVLFGLGSTVLILGYKAVIGFGFGALLTGFFLRVGGGMFRTSASVGNELAIFNGPFARYDQRNPGTFAEMISNIFGPISGVGADLSTSYLFAVIASVIYVGSVPSLNALIHLPFLIAGVAMASTLVAFAWCRFQIRANRFTNIYLEGVYVTVGVSSISVYWILKTILPAHFSWSPLATFACFMVGLIGAVLIGFSSEILTSSHFRFSRRIAQQVENGSTHVFLKGFESSFYSNAVIYGLIAGTAATSYQLCGVFGVTLSAIAMLSVITTILIGNFAVPVATLTEQEATLTDDSYITQQNCLKMVRISGTTVAIRNGFASGAVLVSTLSLLLTMMSVDHVGFSSSQIRDIWFILSILAGLTIPYAFIALIVRGTQRGISTVTTEINRQSKDIPFLVDGKATPDVARITDQLTKQTMDALIIPSAIMLLPVLLVGYFVPGNLLLGLTMGVFFSSFNCTFLWSNLGDSFQQARVFVETGHLGGTDTSGFPVLRSVDQVGNLYREVLSPSINMLLKAVTILTFLIILS